MAIIARFDTSDSVSTWGPIDDRVMGGVSRSRLGFDPAGHGVFEGELSLEQGGGFASVRGPARSAGLRNGREVRIEISGDGKRYRLSFRNDEEFDGIAYQVSFQTSASAGWIRIELPIADFEPTRRGRRLDNAPPLDTSRIRQIGLSISDRQAGSFRLGIRSIEML
jgi:hypothetical protein